jgi:Cft2 family RNA processing exonuclease
MKNSEVQTRRFFDSVFLTLPHPVASRGKVIFPIKSVPSHTVNQVLNVSHHHQDCISLGEYVFRPRIATSSEKSVGKLVVHADVNVSNAFILLFQYKGFYHFHHYTPIVFSFVPQRRSSRPTLPSDRTNPRIRRIVNIKLGEDGKAVD